MSFFHPKHIDSRSDHTWIQNLKQEDAETVQDLWEMVFIYGMNTARRYGQGADIGREAAIAAYLRIQNRGVNQFQFKCPFPAYCRLIVVREVKRRLKKLPPPEAELSEEIYIDEDAPDTTQLSTTKIHIHERLAPCLELLPSRKIEIIRRRYFEDEPPESIAEALGISRGNVNKIAHDARLKLRDCLEQRGFLTTDDVLGL